MDSPLAKMEKRIELEKRGRQAEEIEELNLDNCRATQIAGLTDEFKNLQSLSLISVGLTSLKGFPNLPKLRKLELSDNRISGSLSHLHGCASLSYLNLSGNKISTIETLEPLKQLANLQNLDLVSCEVASVDGYREKVFELLDGLVFLDGFDRDNQEADDEDEEGDVDGASSSEDGEDGVSGEENELNGEDSDDDIDDDDDDGEDDDDDESDLDGEEAEEGEEEGGGEGVSKGVKRKHDDEEKDEDGEEEEEDV